MYNGSLLCGFNVLYKTNNDLVDFGCYNLSLVYTGCLLIVNITSLSFLDCIIVIVCFMRLCCSRRSRQGQLKNKTVSCRREAARYSVWLKILLSYSSVCGYYYIQ